MGITLNKSSNTTGPRERKRAGIFFFFDAEGIVDDYIIFFLQSIMKHLKKLVIVCNGPLASSSKQAFARFTDEVIIRANEGFDAWAYKTGIDYLGTERLESFDELILMNFTAMGPIDSFDEMFSIMDKRENLDFWGITRHAGLPDDPTKCSPYGLLPPHIQSYFTTFRNSVLSSDAFKKYWKTLPPISSYNESIGLHETRLTRYLSEAGFTWDCFVDTADLERLTPDPFQLLSLECVRDRRAPVFKRKSFIAEKEHGLSFDVVQNNGSRLYDYLANKTTYDTTLIMKNLLRTSNQRDIADSLNLFTILSDHASACPPPPSCTIAFVADITDISITVHMQRYLEMLTDFGTLFLINRTTSSACPKHISDCVEGKTAIHYRAVTSEKPLFRQLGRLAEEYELLCVFEGVTMNRAETLADHSKQQYYLTNLAGCQDIIFEIARLFSEQALLGFLSPQPHSLNAATVDLQEQWSRAYAMIETRFQQYFEAVPLSLNKPPLSAMGNAYWIRGSILGKINATSGLGDLLDAMPNNLPSFCLPLLVQKYGYYPMYYLSHDAAAESLARNTWEYEADKRDSAEKPKIAEDTSTAKEADGTMRRIKRVFAS